jgi:hypothetical protein
MARSRSASFAAIVNGSLTLWRSPGPQDRGGEQAGRRVAATYAIGDCRICASADRCREPLRGQSCQHHGTWRNRHTYLAVTITG